MNHYFISAIDTEVGKTIATGLLGKYLSQRQNVITMKIAQTGCVDFSEDIRTHRQLMQMPWQKIDEQGLTCPYLFPYPASPHLSARLVDKKIDTKHIELAFDKIKQSYDSVLVEGVGGLMVPLTEDLLLIDWLAGQSLPIILVTSGKLGSINHTLLSFDALKRRNLNLYGVIYNHYPNDSDIIFDDTRLLLKKYSKQFFPDCRWGEILMMEKRGKTPELLLENNWFE